MEEMMNKIAEARSQGKKIGLVQGSWDLFHLGHLRYLLKAKEACDFLVIAMDSDEKIQKRKGKSRPIIPENERYEFLTSLNIGNYVYIKPANEPKWNLIKTIRPDVLIAIKENYTDEQLKELKEYVGKVDILPRQSETSTSDKIRKIIISNSGRQLQQFDEEINKAIDNLKKKLGYSNNLPEPIPMLFEHLKESTDSKCPVAAACFWNGSWFFGENKCDFNISQYDIDNRTELYYSTVEHAEMNLLKKLGEVPVLDTPVWTTLLPCDKCLKVLISKGVKEIHYLEDHEERNWSKRSHELAKKNGIKLIKYTPLQKETLSESVTDMNKFKFIYPPNARHQEQLDIMTNMESEGKDPLSPEFINQEILFMTDYWHVSMNKFPYKGVSKQFLIVAKQPIYNRSEITTDMWLDLQKIWDYLCTEYNIPGGALCMRFGEPSLSGASLKRVHLHVIEPEKDKKVKFTIGGATELEEGLTLKRLK